MTSSLSRLGGGIPHVVWALAKWQKDCGSEVSVVGLKDKYTADDIPEYQKIPFYVGEVLGPVAFGYSRDISRKLLSQKDHINIVHSHGLWMYPGLAARQLARRKGIPLVISPHGMLSPWHEKRSKMKKIFATWLYEKNNLRSASCLHCLTMKEAEYLRCMGLVNPLAIIPNGVDLKQFNKLPDREVAEKYWPSLKGKKIVLFLGRIHPKKGLIHLIKAWRRVLIKYPEWHLAIAGFDEGGYLEEVKRAVFEAEVVQGVTFAGASFSQKKISLLSAANVFVLPSFSEGFSMAVLEAMACALPVLISQQCNFDEVASSKAGILIEPSVDGIEKGLMKLVCLSEVELMEIGKRGRNLVVKKYSWQIIAEQTICLYEWLLGRIDMPSFVELI